MRWARKWRHRSTLRPCALTFSCLAGAARDGIRRTLPGVPASNALMEAESVNWDWVLHAWQGGSSSDAPESQPKLGLVILSTPLSESLLRWLWQLTERHIVADGGANKLHRKFPELLPDVLVGDFDSAEPAVIEAFRAKGVDVRDLREDQDSTDLEKALAVAVGDGCERVLVAGMFAGVQGRLDHTFGVMNALYRSLASGLQVALVSDDCCCFLLGKGQHNFRIAIEGPAPYCGLVPLGEPCTKISTRGLEWDMQDASMQFGGLVSTSNRVDTSQGGKIWVQTSGSVLWMCSRPQAAAAE